MAADISLPEILADIRRKIREPYRWPQVRALMPLFFIRLAGAFCYVLSVLGVIPGFLYTAIEWLLNAGSAVCLFVLVSVHSRYRPAAVFMTVSLAIGLLSVYTGTPPLLMTLSALCVLICGIFEFSGHGKIAARQNKKLAKKWDALFLWNIGAMFAGAFAFFMTQMLSYLLPPRGLYMQLLSTAVIYAITYVPDLVVDILYLVYLGRTIRLVKKQEV